MDAQSDRFDHLDAGGRGIAAIARQARWTVYAALAVAITLAWVVLFSMAVQVAATRAPGVGVPGDTLLPGLPAVPMPELLRVFVRMCIGPASVDDVILSSFFALAAMWVLMAVAMMLPSAAPLIRTYCEIADTAAAKGERAVHPIVLVSGYMAVWVLAALGFAAVTALLQFLFETETFQPATNWVAAGALMAAGVYQFSSLKEACLKKCRRPFSILFARWTVRPRGILRLGAEQGIWCLGCCWALMLVMFAVGLMNVFWMALIGVLTLAEKQLTGPLLSRVSGAILLVWGAALLVVSFLTG